LVNEDWYFVKFGWRGSAQPEPEVDELDNEPEVDQEFEDACLALALSDGPRPAFLDVPEFDDAPVGEQGDSPAVLPATVMTAGDLAEDLRDDDDADVEVEQDVNEVAPSAPAPSNPVEPEPDAAPSVVRATVSESDLAAAEAELAATRAELDALRSDFEAERFYAREERARLKEELAAARSVAEPGSSPLADPLTDPLADSGEVLALHQEIDALRGELTALRSQHADDLARLRSDLKASQSREAQTVIAAQLAEDELKAIRADHETTRQALETTQSQGMAGKADLEAAQAAFDDALKASSRELAAAGAERDALRQVLGEVEAKEAALAADWDVERRALQDEIRAVGDAGDQRVRRVEAELADRENDLRVARESAADAIRRLEGQLAAARSELAATQQELLDAEMRRAEEAASFLQALKK
jgi:hypothetical protein